MANKIIHAFTSTGTHFDVGSRVDGFISHLLAADIPVTMIDIRPLHISVPGLQFICSDAMRMDNIADNSISSLSSLHAIEHFGLGRYGDPVNPDAWEIALASFVRVLKPGGRLYLSVPVGCKEKLMFNAHRIFSPATICNVLQGVHLLEFAILHDYQITNYDVRSIESIQVPGEYDCGMFIFEKEPAPDHTV